MASDRERRDRRQAKQALSQGELMNQQAYVSRRCGVDWVEAWAVLSAEDTKFEEFADARWTCGQCPNLLDCTLSGNARTP
jgi:hypothetical protein